MKKQLQRVSIHGGHSGQFCLHASNTLEEIVQAYINEGFAWVGITEHMPPSEEAVIYPEERNAGLSPDALQNRFGRYVAHCRYLQQKYRERITLYVGMETENYPGCAKDIAALRRQYQLEYIVGSVHHLDTIALDYSRQEYARLAEHCGGMDAMYCRYFDDQYDMLTTITPEVVGHFDLIRIFDDNYRKRLEKPAIRKRIVRNLDVIAQAGLILDYNLRAFFKGAQEPYVSRSILEMALQRGIGVVPGDDSHGVDGIGVNIDEAMRGLGTLGFDANWQRPSSTGRGGSCY
ncbi:MAG: histidinol-phosphatase [Desulfopila sp.]